MRLEIKSLHLENFKGCKDRTVYFDGNTKVFGANSAGKSTLFCAWMWLISGVNEHLVSNPNITPLGESECVSAVTAEITIDGQPCTISKSQKYKEKFDANSEKTVCSTVNSYTVNGVEKSATTFVTEMKERGVDMDNFLMLSHVFAFTADSSKKGREEMRKVLFEMVKDVTDLDIAKEMTGIADLTIELGKNYKLEEVEQMAKSSLKKITDTYGKSGEIIDAKISGLLDAKSLVDINALPERETNARNAITHIETEIKILESGDSELRIKSLEADIKELEIKAKDEFYRKRQEHIDDHNVIIDKYRDVESAINRANKTIAESETAIEGYNTLLESLRVDYEDVFNKQYDGDTICPTCHRELPIDMIAVAKANFESTKAKNLESIKKSADSVHRDISEKEQLIADAKETISRMSPSLEMLKEQLDEWEKVSITEPRLEDIPGVAELQAEISELKAQTTNSSNEKLNSLYEALSNARNDLSDVEATYKALENNKAIDEKVIELREQKQGIEVQKSQHEKMLWQIEQFKQYKNNKLSDEINAHFKVAQFRLYKVLKNGSIEDDCAVLVNGKEMTTQLNQAMQIRAMLDIINGLSTFKDTFFPVFIDDASLLTQETINTIDMQNQLIWLFAKDGYSELTVERS